MNEINSHTLKIFFEDRFIILVEKPQGMPSVSDKTTNVSLSSFVSDYTGAEVFPVHRLDRPVGGLMLFCKTQPAAKAFNNLIAARLITKQYLVVACGVSKQKARLVDYMLKNERLNVSKIVPKNTTGAKECILEYETVKRFKCEKYGELSVVKVTLVTGRHHQIRIQLLNAGLPIYGDTKYNPMFARVKEFVNIALWSYTLEFTHPFTNKCLKFESIPANENIWQNLCL